jgi:hypothetical protein
MKTNRTRLALQLQHKGRKQAYCLGVDEKTKKFLALSLRELFHQ